MAKVKINCYADKSDLEILRDQDLHGTISFVMSTKEIYLGKDKYCDATSDVAAAITNSLKNYYNKAEVDRKIADVVAGGEVDLSGYATIDQLDNLATKAEVEKKADKTQLTNLATKAEVSTKADKSALTNLATKSELSSKADKSALTNLATKSELGSKADKSELTGLATKTEVNAKADKSALTSLATKSEVSTIKTTAEGAKTQAGTNKSDIASIKAQLANVATKEDLRNIDIALFDVVTKLPAAGKTNKVYLVPDTTSADTQNKYIEYAWINSKWEKVGEFAPKVDLSEYVKTSQLTEYATKSELGPIMSAAQVGKDWFDMYIYEPPIITVDNLPDVNEVMGDDNKASKYKIFAVLDPDSNDPKERYIKYRPVRDVDTGKWRWERVGRCAPTKKEFNANVARLTDLQKNTSVNFVDMRQRISRTEDVVSKLGLNAGTVDKLTLNGTKLNVGQINARGGRKDNVSVDLLPLMPKVQYVPCEVNISRWTGCTNVSVCGLTNTDPCVISRYIDRSGSKMHPYKIENVSDIYISGNGTNGHTLYKCNSISFGDVVSSLPPAREVLEMRNTIRSEFVKFLHDTNRAYLMNDDVNTNVCYINPYKYSHQENKIVFADANSGTRDYSFNPLTFFNPDFSSKVYNMYMPQFNTIYVFSFKPKFP